jgi:Ca-activated chloride channel family protein
MRALVFSCCLCASAAQACDIALVLAMDVSGSVDAGEYGLQVVGLAAALRDPEVQDLATRGRAAMTVLQWSDVGQQVVSIPWTRIHDAGDARALAARVAAMPRAFERGETALGEAITAALAQFPAVRDCAAWVIDVSGDGIENAGFTVGRARAQAIRRGVTINGLAIEDHGPAQPLTQFYERWVVTPGGFVETARGHQDFARAIHRKLIRELATPVALAVPERIRLAFSR